MTIFFLNENHWGWKWTIFQEWLFFFLNENHRGWKCHFPRMTIFFLEWKPSRMKMPFSKNHYFFSWMKTIEDENAIFQEWLFFFLNENHRGWKWTIFQEWLFFFLNENHQGWKWRCKKVWTHDLPLKVSGQLLCHQFMYKSQYSNYAYHNHHNPRTTIFCED